MKRIIAFVGVFLVGLLLGLFLGFGITAPRKVGISDISVSKQVINNQEVLIVDSQEHPPWAQQHLTSVEFDYDKRTISILRYAVIFNPGFRRGIYSRWPVIIRDGLPNGEFTLLIGRTEGFAPVGKVVRTDKKLEYLPLASGH
jgi:hypothetical protein